MGQEMKDSVSKIATMMLMASGADIVAPKDLKRQTIETLELNKNSNFIAVNDELEDVENQDEKLAIISGLILTHLTPSQMLHLHEVIHTGVRIILESSR